MTFDEIQRGNIAFTETVIANRGLDVGSQRTWSSRLTIGSGEHSVRFKSTARLVSLSLCGRHSRRMSNFSGDHRPFDYAHSKANPMDKL